jgi:FkbM family methyltransferase
MEGTAAHAPVLTYLAQVAADTEFMLIDIGCSGGIDGVWRRFGPRLRAIGIDPNLTEIDRLKRTETHAGIQYVAAFAGIAPDHPLALRKTGRSDWGRNPWDRLSTARSLRGMKEQQLSGAERTAANLWPDVELADAARPLVIPEYLRERGVQNVDFLKIDIDGKDLDVLQSFDSALERLGVLGLGLEVNFHGSDADTDHTLHNTDRYMKAQGFELFNLTVRRYSLAALPSRYLLNVPAQTEFGRPLQGDALYIRDLGSPERRELAERLPPGKLLNLVAIFAAFNLPDCAAEIAVSYRTALAEMSDVDRVLDLLAAQAQGDVERPLTYREYMEAFDRRDPMFLPPGAETSGLRGARPLTPRVASVTVAHLLPTGLRESLRRLRRAWRILREPRV